MHLDGVEAAVEQRHDLALVRHLDELRERHAAGPTAREEARVTTG
jgi:hypothetical protein